MKTETMLKIFLQQHYSPSQLQAQPQQMQQQQPQQQQIQQPMIQQHQIQQIVHQIPSLQPQQNLTHHIQTINHHPIQHQNIIYQHHQPTQILQLHQIKKETS